MQLAPDCYFAYPSTFWVLWNSDHYVETEIDSHTVQDVNEKNCYLASFDEVPFETMYDTETNKRRTVCSCFRIEKVWSRRIIIALF